MPEGLTSAAVFDDRVVLYGPRRAALWSATSGLPTWTRRRPSATEAAWVSKNVVMLRTESGLHGVNADTGHQLYRIAVPRSAMIVMNGTNGITSEGRDLRFVDLQRGQLRSTLTLGADIEAGWLVAGHLFVALKNGRLAAVDVKRRRRLTTVPVRVKDAAIAGPSLAVVDREGRLLLFDHRRAFRPE